MNEVRAPLRRLYGLQYLRATAALAVLSFHALGSPDHGPVGALVQGVDLFFVLSGFLMVAITDAETRPWPFLKDRVLRIVPTYWIATLAASAFLIALSPTWSLAGHVHQAVASLLFIPFQQPGDAHPFPILAVGWTLNLEMLFYALFALTLVLPRRAQLPVLTLLLLALTLIGPFLPWKAVAWRFWTQPISLEFLAGAWLGRAYQREDRLWPVLLAVLAATIVLLAILPRDPPPRIFSTPFILALLAFVLVLERRPGGIPEFRLPRLLGDASYSIYLWQILAIFIGNALAHRFALAPGATAVLIFSGGTVGGVLAYFLVERPLLAISRRTRRFRHGAPIPGGV